MRSERERYIDTDSQTDRQEGRQTDKHKDRQRQTQTPRHPDMQTHRHSRTHAHTHKHSHKHTKTNTDRLTCYTHTINKITHQILIASPDNMLATTQTANLYKENKKEKYTCTHMYLDLCLNLSVSNSCNNRVSDIGLNWIGMC